MKTRQMQGLSLLRVQSKIGAAPDRNGPKFIAVEQFPMKATCGVCRALCSLLQWVLSPNAK
eukprot:2264221-Amphidinium_carterae.1